MPAATDDIDRSAASSASKQPHFPHPGDVANTVADAHLPLLADARRTPDEVKPSWRGWIHAATFPIAIALGVVLVTLADGTAAKASTAVFFASSLLLFGVSALYHRINWSPGVKRTFKRLDHANIFLLIAGTYTPMAVLGLPWPKSIILLSIVWVGAALGIGFRVFWVGAPRWLYVPLYVLLGWAAMMYLLDFFAAVPVSMILVLAGGIFYTVGAVFYGLKRPNPLPGVFGFHELFHACTLLAFLSHWTAILLIAHNPPAF
ncbi:PAQR family membrane homeostasis protein TrhA [Mycobacterium sp.]|uniref:PAQR family membrane homeostasis protein TrhA n=1 Tax=Mycobacterium sp. TaxID=1785 RepID=UPI003A861E46